MYQILVGFYLFKFNNRDTQYNNIPNSGVFIDNFEHISHPVLVFLLLTLDM